MAAIVGKSPLILSSVGDNVAEHYCITSIRVVAGGSTEFVILDKAGGREIFHSASLSNGETDEVSFDGHWVDGLYLSQGVGNAYIYYK